MRSAARVEAEGDNAPRVWFAQAIRGFAALLVAWVHLTQNYVTLHDTPLISGYTFSGRIQGLPDPTVDMRVIAWLQDHGVWLSLFAVALFFLVSGFVIPFSLERRNLSGFFVRRFFRIYPTLWAALLVVLVIVTTQTGLEGFPYGAGDIAWSGLLISKYTGTPIINPVIWTLAVEELFYFIAAFCAMGGVLKSRIGILLIALALTLTNLTVGNAQPSPDGSNPALLDLRRTLGVNATFVIFILIGVVLHEHYRGRWQRTTPLMVAILFALYAGCLQAGGFGPDGGEPYFWSSALALGVWLALYAWRRRIGYSRAVDWLAAISYPLYLVHAVVGWYLLDLFVPRIGFSLALPLALAGIVALSAILHHVVETPSNELGRRIAARLTARSDDPQSLPSLT